MGKLVLLTESLAYWHFKVKQIKLQAPETLIMKGMPDPVLLPSRFLHYDLSKSGFDYNRSQFTSMPAHPDGLHLSLQ